VLKVADASNLNVKGDFTFLALVADAATCKATVNSWYTDATTVWVHTFDSRSPDVNVRCYFDNANNGGVLTANTTTTYFENIDFEGSAANSCFGVGHVTNLKTVYFNNCTFKYAAAGNGFMASPGAVTYLKDCVAACNFMDGFSYKATGGAAPKAVEINCIGRDNGSTGDLDNGSTSHEGTSIVRIMGEYARNVGRNVHDISNSTLSWNLGCNSHDSTSAVNDCNFAAGATGAETTKMWLDCCTSSGSATDLEETAAAVLSYRNLISDGSFVGTPVSY
jgi:hypothetical protein